MKTPADIWERCPVCRARLKDSTECFRCGMDFSPALSVHIEAEKLVARALFELREGRSEEAFMSALRAAEARSTPEIRKALAVAAVASGRFDLALSLWRSMREFSGENEKKKDGG